MYLIEHVMAFVLGGFLSFSGFAAHELQSWLTVVGAMPAPVALTYDTPANNPEQEVRTPRRLPSRFETGGSIPRILIDNAGYQEASVIGASATTTALRPDASAPDTVKDALVNVFCSYREDEARVRVTTGSGVFIDSRGIILTNAHVAQFLLLAEKGDERKTRCTIRTGSPAEAAYIAQLLYISPAWIRENANLIDAEHPSGTGERDYALLYVSESLAGDMPESFPALPFSTTPLSQHDRGSEIIAGGYPAEILRDDGPRAELVPKIATTTITELYTFSANHADLIAIGSSRVGEQGSSGGPIVREDGSLIGLIVTRGNDEDGATSLRAITLPYINNTIKEETGFDLIQTLSGDPAFRADVFNTALTPFLSELLTNEL